MSEKNLEPPPSDTNTMEEDFNKLRQIIQQRKLVRERNKTILEGKRKRGINNDHSSDYCQTKWVVVDTCYLEYYGFRYVKYCNIHNVNKTLHVVHNPTCKTNFKCHSCGNSCVPKFLCIPCSGEINKANYYMKKKAT